MTAGTELPAAIRRGLNALGLLAEGDGVSGVPLTGGVSSDIWRVDIATGPVVAKRALERLRVEATWIVPTSRTAHEAAWLRDAARAVPALVPRALGYDAASGVLVLEWLDPARFGNWKAQLSAGPLTDDVGAGVAAALGDRLGAVHAAMSDPARDAAAFATGDLFGALRLDPYLRVTAGAHPDLAGRLDDLAERTAATGRTVIHGDVSPKNVLVGPDGPVLVDAECATWGDPAFDVAFCLNHLLLKGLWHPDDAAVLARASDALVAGYRSHVAWEDPDELDERVATLVPALALARVDGASPVEYLDDAQRDDVRHRARTLLIDTPATVTDLLTRWFHSP